MINLRSMDNSDKYTIFGLIASLILWWVFVGSGKYGSPRGTKGIRRYV